jgi:predicted ATPase with chaperone activity
MNRAAESISSSTSEPQLPREPASLEDTGLAESTLERLILNTLYFRGDLYGQDLSSAIGLRFSVLQEVLESLKLRHLVQIKRSLGVAGVGSQFALTDAGRSHARDGLETNQYIGPAPVPLDQYMVQVRRQRPREGWLTKAALAKALSGMVITRQALAQVGPAVSSCKSLLVYGKPGDGKTFLIESLNNLESTPVFVPYAIECQGNIIQVFDPIYHQPIEKEPEPSVFAIAKESPYDRRWAKCVRPFIVSGGELSLDMLDLRFNHNSKVYEAPFQLKANSGIYLIDDFGRQRATPAEVLNRWIVPMERRVDYLSFMTGGKMTVPFETFLVFSTNLNPEDIGDEAFLRRIQYKMLLRGPSVSEFSTIFKAFCAGKGLPCPPGLVDRFVERRYKKTGKPFRRCHPRDVLTHALNLIHFERLPLELTHELLDRAFESCFVQEHEEAADDVVVVNEPIQSCEDFWSQQALEIPAALGRMAYAAAFKDRTTGQYSSPTPNDYDQAENCRVLQNLHSTAFREWLNRTLEQRSRDLADYLSTPEGRSAYLSFGQRELVAILVPADAQRHEKQLFQTDFTAVLLALSQQRPAHEAPATLVERIA